MSEPPRWLDRRAAAAYLSIGSGTLDNKVREGLLPKPSRQLGDRSPRWDRDALDRAMGGQPSAVSSNSDIPPENSWDDLEEALKNMVFLHSREEKALKKLASSPHRYKTRLWMPFGVGKATLDGLVKQGFAERGPCPHRGGEMGWGITAEGRKAIKRG